MAKLDHTLGIPVKGYAWLPDLRRRAHGQPVHLRLLGRPALAISGPSAAQFFYQPGHFERHSAVPEPVVVALVPPEPLILNWN